MRNYAFLFEINEAVNISGAYPFDSDGIIHFGGWKLRERDVYRMNNTDDVCSFITAFWGTSLDYANYRLRTQNYLENEHFRDAIERLINSNLELDKDNLAHSDILAHTIEVQIPADLRFFLPQMNPALKPIGIIVPEHEEFSDMINPLRRLMKVIKYSHPMTDSYFEPRRRILKAAQTFINARYANA